MKSWIRFILKVNRKLDKMCFNVERKIDRLSKNLDRPTGELCNEVFEWTDFKRRLINLRVLHNNLMAGLDAGEWERLIEWKDYKSTASKGLIHKCESILTSLGYGKERFDEDYQKNKKLLENFNCD